MLRWKMTLREKLAQLAALLAFLFVMALVCARDAGAHPGHGAPLAHAHADLLALVVLVVAVVLSACTWRR